MPSSRSMPALPAGFRFHPTDEELMVHYLMNQAASVPCPVPIIAEVNIYHCNPWDLPAKAVFGENEWYFFSPRDRKYPNGTRPNRAAGSGYWKATGTDKAILSTPAGDCIGVKKALVFYKGKPPRGVKTDWIMHEYRLTVGDRSTKRRGSSMRLDDWVLCRIHKKSNDFQLSDQEQEGSSTVDEEPLMDSMNTTAGASSPKSGAPGHDDQFQFQFQPMSKSCSLTDLLNPIDYSALFLDAAPAEEVETPQQQSPLLIYPTPTCQEQLNYYNCNDANNNSMNMSHIDLSSDYYSSSGNYNGLKRIMTMDGAANSFDDGTCFSKKLQQLPSDSRSSYRNQLVVDTSGFQCSLPLLNRQLLLNSNHLEMP